MRLQTVHLLDVPATPWRNGGGSTRELLAWPAAPDWQLRISVATIDRSGPFSAYAGIERWFAVLSGDGVRLQVDQEPVVMTPASPPLCFDGAAAPQATLLGSATQDLNLMLRQGAGTGGLLRANAGAGDGWTCHAAWRGLLTMGPGQLQIDGQAPLPLAAASLAWCDDAADARWAFAASQAHAAAAAYWLHWQPHPR